jgi:hypothetical protein
VTGDSERMFNQHSIQSGPQTAWNVPRNTAQFFAIWFHQAGLIGSKTQGVFTTAAVR